MKQSWTYSKYHGRRRSSFEADPCFLPLGESIYAMARKMKRSEINRQFAPIISTQRESKEKKQKAQRGVIEESSRKFPPTNQGISSANAMQFVTTENQGI